MSHQDWDTVTFRKKAKETKEVKKIKKNISQKAETIGKFIAPSNFRKEMMQSRVQMKMTQQDLASKMNIQQNVIRDWESGKSVPNNNAIGKIERAIGVKLPRCKKIKKSESED